MPFVFTYLYKNTSGVIVLRIDQDLFLGLKGENDK